MLKGGKILILLNIADLLLTGVGLRMSFFKEENFILQWYHAYFGVAGIAAMKIIAVIPLILAIEFGRRKGKIIEEKAKSYYAAANLTFILPFCFFTGIVNLSGYNVP